jgi:hypothetical protein
MRPTYLGLGPPRTTTTSIHLALRDHPDIDQVKAKELHWFNSSDWTVDSIQQYESNWQDTAKSARGEITPTYISYSDRILSVYPDIKFFIVRRDPIDRLISHLKLDLFLTKSNGNMTKEEFEQFKLNSINQFQSKILARDFTGFILEQSHNRIIQDWQSRLPESQLLVLDFKNLTGNLASQRTEINRLYNFLGVDSMPVRRLRHVNSFPGLEVNLDPEVLDILSNYFTQ